MKLEKIVVPSGTEVGAIVTITAQGVSCVHWLSKKQSKQMTRLLTKEF